MLRFPPVLALAAAAVACDPPPPPVPSTATAPPASVQASPPPASVAPPAAADLAALARSNNAFGLDLYGKIRDARGNLALAPASLSTALTLTWAGARGETAAQMKKVLHLDGAPEQAMDVAGKLAQSYRDPQRPVTIRVANRLFGEKSYTFDRAYVDRARASFGAPLDVLDFKGDADGSRRRINDWVAGETQSRIKDLIPAGGVDAETRLVLANATYFQGDWELPFDRGHTRPEPFHATVAETKDVPTMRQTAHFRFAATDGVKVLELPYKGRDLAMTLVLPDAADGLAAVEQRLTPATLDGWTAALRAQEVRVALPKFEIDPASSLSLREPLAALGMPIAFERGRADFTGMASPPSPDDRLHIAKVFHKAFVKLDEKGTEAAGASAVVMAIEGAAAPTTAPPEFRADHPFLFFLRDVRSGLVLFMGRVSDPSAK